MNVILQERDYRLFKELDSCGYLSYSQVAHFLFDGNMEAARKRITKLKNANYISIVKVSQKLIVQAGGLVHKNTRIKLQREIRRLTKPVNRHCIKHELAIRYLKLALGRLNGSHSQFEIKDIIIEQKLLCFKVDTKVFRPDAFALISDKPGEKHSFFFEVDMGNETHWRLMDKIKMYELFRKSGGFALWRGGKREDHALYAFRIIFVVTEKRRAARLRRAIITLNKQNFVFVVENQDMRN